MLRVAHIITGLDTGGAETMLYTLLTALQQQAEMLDNEADSFDAPHTPVIHSHVYSLSTIGPVGERIAALGIAVHELGMKPNMPNPAKVLELARWLQDGHYHLVQTWLYHGDLIGGAAAWLAGGIPTAWGIHNTRLDPDTESRRTILIARILARLSRRLPRKIVLAAQAARAWHGELGYDTGRMVVIPNGFDLTRFQPDPAARTAIRAELEIPPDAPVVGMVARFEPVKDHQNFVQAARRLHEQQREACFVLAGKDVTWDNDALSGWIGGGEFRRKFRLLGLRSDAARLFNAFDVATLSSRREAFPLTIGEAMACGVPAVVTDVGDAAELVGETGRVVPPGDSEALAQGWSDLLGMDTAARRAAGQAARQRIETHYSLDLAVQRYVALWDSIAR
ncbi:MAG: glycosyltransferase [bacterium]|nr:glycosyltransferase [bacterium]